MKLFLSSSYTSFLVITSVVLIIMSTSVMGHPVLSREWDPDLDGKDLILRDYSAMGKRGQCCAKPSGGKSPTRTPSPSSSGTLKFHKSGTTPPPARHSTSSSSSSSHGGSPIYHGHSMRLHSANVKDSPPYSPPAHHLSSSFKRPSSTSFVQRPVRQTKSFSDSHTGKQPTRKAAGAKGITIKEHTQPRTPARVDVKGKGKGPAVKSPASSSSSSPTKTPRGGHSGASGSHHH